MNPKAIDLKHLYGEFDPINMEWKDGVISSVFRRFSDKKLKNTFKWMIFDGPVYPAWIENLNTLLDDNRKLCLSSGEVLNLTENTMILFEVDKLNHASPSTVRIEKIENQEGISFLCFRHYSDFTSWNGLL